VVGVVHLLKKKRDASKKGLAIVFHDEIDIDTMLSASNERCSIVESVARCCQ
jgi:hypothetical protein